VRHIVPNLFPTLIVYATLFMANAILGFNLVGDGVRDALDPRLRGSA
jgi:peptide/nickel transport system permease protein